ncbi:hypothetical protein OVN20_00110 [Microcella daejeonensis]|uniref:hypothetical protein n=1 Tax=Microcella daejeonensis TaxID=2994971 RepID=UPI00227077DC|nr:hypothetical protein [Microcella daejeonensis]WAB84024.1 hypothetical protein OVN20_00110 [Microcella daejeonensis]
MDDTARLKDDLEELREAVLDDWILVTTRNVDAIRSMEQTLSWRVTKPLRVLRSVQRRASDVGYVRAGQLAAARVAEKLGRG